MNAHRPPSHRPSGEEPAQEPAQEPVRAHEAGRRVSTPAERKAQDDARTALVKAEVEAAARATDEKTARLRALRLARDQGAA